MLETATRYTRSVGHTERRFCQASCLPQSDISGQTKLISRFAVTPQVFTSSIPLDFYQILPGCGESVHNFAALVSKNPVRATLARCRTLFCGRQ